MKVCTNKEKTARSSKRKRKLDFSKEEREEKQSIPMASAAETPNSKKKKVAKQAEFKNHESSIQRQSPRSVQKTCSINSAVKAPIAENQEEMKAKDLEIRKIVRDIIFGGVTNPAKNHSSKVSKDAMQSDTSNEEASRINCLNGAQKSGLATYSRKNKSPKQGNRKIECKRRNGVKGVKKVATKVLETPNSRRDGSSSSMKSNAEKMAARHPSRNLKGKGTKEHKTSNNEARKSTLKSRHVEKKNDEGHRKAKSPELEAKTPAKVSIIFAVFYVFSLH
jgi:hypothetical protein